MPNRLKFAVAASVLALGFATTAQAAAVLVGTFSGNECGGQGGFSNCYAYANGTTSQGQNGGGSPTVFKQESGGGSEISTLFPTIDGSEFDVDYTGATNTLSFTYTPDAGDPFIHYFAIFQAGTTKLFHDAAAITSGTIDLDNHFPDNPGFSHITFFDTGSVVPEPGTWGLMILGIGAVGGVMRRRRQTVRYNFA